MIILCVRQVNLLHNYLVIFKNNCELKCLEYSHIILFYVSIVKQHLYFTSILGFVTFRKL